MNFCSPNTHFYFGMVKLWFLDAKFLFETADVKAMIFCSINTRFYLTMENQWFLDEKFQFETTDVKTINV